MRRREFVHKLGLGSAAAAAAALSGGPALKAGALAPADRDSQGQDHDHQPVQGTNATATVSFGEWRTDPPLDRFVPPPVGAPPPGNVHLMIPQQATVRVGGSVNFVIAGFHQVVVYAPGKRPDQVATNVTRAPALGGPPLINDAVQRVYAGVDPSRFGQDRVEAVQFTRKGLHLVICGVLPHFVNDNMLGWVRVIGDDEG